MTGSRDYERVEKAIRYIDDNFRRQPGLGEVARAVGLSEYHFQRLFRRWAGVSPKRFLQFATAGHAREMLAASRTVLDATYSSGLSGPGRLHDLMVTVDAMTPGEIQRLGAGLVIRYGFHDSPFGDAMVAATDRGLCGLEFVGRHDRPAAVDWLRSRWPHATLRHEDEATAGMAARVFDGRDSDGKIPILFGGTNFQLKVWEALLRIPPGEVATYAEIAERVSSRRSARAVGAAIGRNPVAFVVPCHRAIHSTGAFGRYHWGAERKRAMLAREALAREALARSAPAT